MRRYGEERRNDVLERLFTVANDNGYSVWTGRSKHNVPARIVEAKNDKVVMEIVDKWHRLNYKSGQQLVATLSEDRMAADGKYVKVSDIVFKGQIARVDGNMVTVSSADKQGAVYRSKTLTDAMSHNGFVDVRVLQ